jgi:thiamine pyrophosphokinase
MAARTDDPLTPHPSAGLSVTEIRTNPNLAILAAGGPLAPAEAELLRQTLEANLDAFVVGIDSGARHLLRVGKLPEVVTGDFDSLTLAERESLAAQGVEIVPTPDQEYTDLDKALSYVRERHGSIPIQVFAATGGRLDHIYSVLSAVIKHGRQGDVRLVDAVGETRYVSKSATLRGADLPGRTLSLMAFGTVHLTMTGVRWPLTEEILAPGVRDGTLNEVTEETVTIDVDSGDLLIQLHHAALCYTETDADA